MASTATDVSISSNALMRLGAGSINSFDEADVSGANLDFVKLASNLWPTVRKAVLRQHAWNCATQRVLLSPDSTPPAFGFANRFLIPGDWLKTLQVGIDERYRCAWRSEGRYFLSDEAAFPLVYVFDNQIVGTWDAALVQAVELAMAFAMCYPVTKSTSLKEALGQEFGMVVQQARTADGQDDPGETLGDSILLASRFGGLAGAYP